MKWLEYNGKNLRGQSWMLQFTFFVVDPLQPLPPFSSSIFFVLESVRVPPPQVLEHSPICQAFHLQ